MQPQLSNDALDQLISDYSLYRVGDRVRVSTAGSLCDGPVAVSMDGKRVDHLPHCVGFPYVQLTGRTGKIIAVDNREDAHRYYVQIDGIRRSTVIDGVGLFVESELVMM